MLIILTLYVIGVKLYRFNFFYSQCRVTSVSSESLEIV